eukprot:GHVU01088579.1.p2 GENE.GHVU01088579.1~~GHVU01088579.1.p2  ORF type:complete len:117 (-),score=4.30 GHVU01088579.1:149-499(-)
MQACAAQRCCSVAAAAPPPTIAVLLRCRCTFVSVGATIGYQMPTDISTWRTGRFIVVKGWQNIRQESWSHGNKEKRDKGILFEFAPQIRNELEELVLSVQRNYLLWYVKLQVSLRR